jgi:hypothetical protein
MLTIREQKEEEYVLLIERMKIVCNWFDEIIEENKKIIWALTIPEWTELTRLETRIINN